jgi:signal transduction histidine kinase
MDKTARPQKRVLEYTLPWLVLTVLLIYSYAKFFQHTYGFGWDPNANVYIVFTPQPGASVHVGDRLLQVGSITWQAYRSDLTQTLFQGVEPGQTVPVTVLRHGQTLTIPWRLPGVNGGEIREQMLSEWFLVWVFWGVGTAVLLLVRPRDRRWALLIAFSYLTAIWLSAGSGLSNYHIWYSALVLRVAVWLSVPIYLHLHWVFPRPLGRLPAFVLPVLYGAACVLAIAQGFQALPQGAYFVGFLIALLGSLVLLLLHGIRSPDARRELRIIWVAAGFALAPLLAIMVISIVSGPTRAYTLALLSFPALPLAYLYAAYRRQLGGLELRVNRLISAYLFLILLGTIGMPVIAAADRLAPGPDNTLWVGSAAAALTAMLSIFAFPRFRAIVEGHWLGMSLPIERLPQLYSGRTRTSTSMEALLDVLRRDILPSLLIRQFAFVHIVDGTPFVVLRLGIRETDIVPQDCLRGLSASRPEPWTIPLEIQQRLPWVRLVLPLEVGEALLGCWLLGRRDPDDFYSAEELPILQSIADQTAITLSNILQTQRLHVAYRSDIDRFEHERRRLALDLHDGILNRMAALIMRLDDQSLTPGFQHAYNDLVHHLRGIVNGLRPALLNYGLLPALGELVESLNEGAGASLRFEISVQADASRYPEEVEEHVFRIVQEACANAMHHAGATEVGISGTLEESAISLAIHDNGGGFDPAATAAASAKGHVGIVGMHERAELIGARLDIESDVNLGTSVRIRWSARSTPSRPAQDGVDGRASHA